MVLTSESPMLKTRTVVPEPAKNLCNSIFLTPFCLLRPNASSSCERWILRLSKPCADHASIWDSRPITMSGRARGHSLRPGPWWPRICLILSLDLFCRIVCHTQPGAVRQIGHRGDCLTVYFVRITALSRSYFSPFFQIARLVAAILRATVRVAIDSRIPDATRYSKCGLKIPRVPQAVLAAPLKTALRCRLYFLFNPRVV